MLAWCLTLTIKNTIQSHLALPLKPRGVLITYHLMISSWGSHKSRVLENNSRMHSRNWYNLEWYTALVGLEGHQMWSQMKLSMGRGGQTMRINLLSQLKSLPLSHQLEILSKLNQFSQLLISHWLNSLAPPSKDISSHPIHSAIMQPLINCQT